MRPSTFSSYGNAVRKFVICVQYVQPQATIHRLDRLCAVLGEFSFQHSPRRGSLQHFLYVIHGLEFFLPSLRGKLQYARQAAAGWDNTTPSKSPPPFSRDISLACAAVLKSEGSIAASVAVAVAFHGYFQASEICSLRREDIFFPGDCRTKLPPETMGCPQW